MRVIIIGASGLVGGACYSYFNTMDDTWEVIGTHRKYPSPGTVFFDACNFNLDSIPFKADVVIYCGGLTWVDYCEDHPNESYAENVEAIKPIIDWCRSINAKLVYTSTDYVFDGESGPYSENAPSKPINTYGKHKLAAEGLIRESLTDYLIVRFTNVYGKEARNKNMLARIISAGLSNEQLTLEYPTDQMASPIHSMDIARAIYQLIESDRRGIYHLASSDYLSRYDLAKKVVETLDLSTIRIKGKKTSQLSQKAKRPLRAGVSNHLFLTEFPFFTFTDVSAYLNSIDDERR